MKRDITELDDIKLLVDTFYAKAQKAPLIGEIFTTMISDWQAHLNKMYRFWQTILLEQHNYQRNPFMPHAKMPLSSEHFDTWVGLWCDTVDDLYAGEKANEAKYRGKLMAALFLSKFNYIKDNNLKPIM